MYLRSATCDPRFWRYLMALVDSACAIIQMSKIVGGKTGEKEKANVQ